MVVGRRPKPTAVKRLTGNPGKRKLGESEPKPRPASGRRPRGMSDGAQRLWRGVAGELVRLGLLTVVDVPAFRLMCEEYGIALEAARQVETEGLWTVDAQGVAKKHPVVQVLRDATSTFRMYAVEFGMTPSSRGRLHMEGEDQDDFMSLLFGADVEVGEGEIASPMSTSARNDVESDGRDGG